MRILLLALLLAGCSSTLSGPEIQYRDGAEIRLYRNHAEMVAALPPTMQALAAVAQIRGWYDRERKIIHSTNDPRIIEHELKHHIDPTWTHPVSCVYLPC